MKKGILKITCTWHEDFTSPYLAIEAKAIHATRITSDDDDIVIIIRLIAYS